MDLGLNNKVVVVTGASRGIGEGIAKAFLREGARVINFDIRQQEYQGADYYRVDVSRKDDVIAGVNYVISKYGRIDVLVNNAGIEKYGSVDETSEEDWDRIMTVNVKGPFLLSKYFIPYMLKQGKGVIINIASNQALQVQKRVAAYATSKHALLGLTRSIAVDYAPIIRAIAVCPGPIRTPLLEWAAEQEVGKERIEEKIWEWGNVVPMKRIGTIEEVGNLVVFLASDLASFITGVCILIEGGLSAMLPISTPPK